MFVVQMAARNICLSPSLHGRDIIGYRNKAVAEGAVSFHVDHFVKARVAKYSYGTDAAVLLNPFNEEHICRLHLASKDMNGLLRLQGFSVILPKVRTLQPDINPDDYVFLVIE